jgi:hypothetical protein
MVWGIEKTVLLSTGEPKRGVEVAREALALRAHRQRRGEHKFTASGGRTHSLRADDQRSGKLDSLHPGSRRSGEQSRHPAATAALPRIIGNDPTDLPLSLRKVEPRTQLLREGLDNINPSRYFVFEEEVPRAGARVYQRYQRTRWIGGAAHVWLRVRKDVGRGEGSSGLAFDTLEQSPQASTAAP